MSHPPEYYKTHEPPRQQPVTWLTYPRTWLFYLGYNLMTVIHSINSVVIGSLLPFPLRHRFVNLWSAFTIWWARVICGIHYRVEGLENLPDTPCVVIAKHQSSWETFYLQLLFVPQATVLKKELVQLPFFGWGLRMLEPIVIDRNKKQNALKQVINQGTEKLKQGRWVVIYPEGTRCWPGEDTTYNAGGAMLAHKAGVPVVPLAHNAGECWPAKRYLKTPGTVTVSIGPPIDTRNLSVKEINRQAEQWIENRLLEISDIQRSLKKTPSDTRES